MNKHTPGPWRKVTANDYKSLGVETVSDDIYARVTICEIQLAHGEPFNSDENDEPKANARLIAAAPELLEALKKATMALAWHEQEHGVAMDAVIVEQARAAIAKATGGEK